MSRILNTWWLPIVGLMLTLACLAPILINYGEQGAARVMEDLSIMTSQETWLNLHEGDPHAWLLPTWNGRPRYVKPPMLIWLNLLAWQDLSPETASVDLLIARARLLAAVMMWIAMMATWRAGHCLRDSITGILAAFVMGSMFLFIRQGRTATYDTHLLGWVALAVSCGICAINPTQRKRSFFGVSLDWLFCGLGLGAALLTKGLLSVVLVVIPLFAIIFTRRQRRGRAFLGLFMAGTLGCFIFAAWYVALQLRDSSVLMRVLYEYGFPLHGDEHPPWYYLALILLVFPWSLWLIPGIAHGIRRFKQPAEATALLWFATVFIGLSFPPTKNQRYIVPILPATGLLIAFILREWERLGWNASRLLRILARVHWGLLLLASCALPVFVFSQASWVERGWLDRVEVPGIPALVTISLFVFLLLMVAAGYRFQGTGKVTAAALCTGFWMLGVTTVGFGSYARVPENGDYAQRADAERVSEECGDLPVYYLCFVHEDFTALQQKLRHKNREPDKRFLLYSRRTFPPVQVKNLPSLLIKNEPFYLCVRDVPERTAIVEKMGFRHQFDFEDGERPGWKLYKKK